MEELNRYLSNLSEHHDMYVFQSIPTLGLVAVGLLTDADDCDLFRPRIGPG